MIEGASTWILAAPLLIELAYGPRFLRDLPWRDENLGYLHPEGSTNLCVMQNWKPGERSLPPHQALWWGPVHACALTAVLKAAELAGYVTIANRAFVKRNRRQQITYQMARGYSVL